MYDPSLSSDNNYPFVIFPPSYNLHDLSFSGVSMTDSMIFSPLNKKFKDMSIVGITEQKNMDSIDGIFGLAPVTG